MHLLFLIIAVAGVARSNPVTQPSIQPLTPSPTPSPAMVEIGEAALLRPIGHQMPLNTTPLPLMDHGANFFHDKPVSLEANRQIPAVAPQPQAALLNITRDNSSMEEMKRPRRQASGCSDPCASTSDPCASTSDACATSDPCASTSDACATSDPCASTSDACATSDPCASTSDACATSDPCASTSDACATSDPVPPPQMPVPLLILMEPQELCIHKTPFCVEKENLASQEVRKANKNFHPQDPYLVFEDIENQIPPTTTVKSRPRNVPRIRQRNYLHERIQHKLHSKLRLQAK
ncbi:unnamed protein product [Notodromas monacha]|uniref:Uncharacterized protein n=1 Tax=Notodromas monacha TaxID=399045 RepID=A0A7R9BU22_9CRUS|nr:unnamed protein product [Notodromas monacha]CAG0920130.1 unnamed protein product [Notodromas monacha]